MAASDSAARGAAPAYTRSLLDLLGDRDPLAVQRQLPARLEEAVAGLSDADLRRREAPGKWSILEVLVHLADTEMVYGYRMRMIAAHDEPDIQGYDQDRWAERLLYNEADLGATLERLRVLRRANLAFLESLSEADWERTGHHSERGPESLRIIARLIAAHDLVHRRQIGRIKQTHGLT